MKRKLRVAGMVACLMLIMSLVLMSVGCGGGGSSLKVTFDYNYTGAPAAYVQEIESGAQVTPPEDPQREGYAFTGWYTDASATSKADFGYGITENETFYAGWRQTSVTVTFDPNYEGGEASTESVEIGGKVTQPQDPVWDDAHLFKGWYTDEACTEEYDFDTTVTGAFTLYAGWDEVDLSDTVSMTYLYNYEGAPNEGVYYTTRVRAGRRPTAPADPARNGYYFADWYADAACTVKYDFQQAVEEDATVYAKWFNAYTFEAEYTDLVGKEGNGYSSSASGTDLIMNDIGGTLGQQTGQAGASNGFYIASLYEPELSIDFNIVSDADVTDAVLVLRLSVEYYDMTFTPNNFTILVNGDALEYSAIVLEGAVDVADENELGKRPFSNHTITTALSLKEGPNTINLVISNTTELGGTMYAEAPMIDCMYVYTDAHLSWTPIEDNLIGKL